MADNMYFIKLRTHWLYKRVTVGLAIDLKRSLTIGRKHLKKKNPKTLENISTICMYMYVFCSNENNIKHLKAPCLARTVAEEEIPDTQQHVKGQVACEEAHEPVRGKHERLHSVVLQVFVSSWASPFQNPHQQGRVKQNPLLQDQTSFKSNHKYYWPTVKQYEHLDAQFVSRSELFSV